MPAVFIGFRLLIVGLHRTRPRCKVPSEVLEELDPVFMTMQRAQLVDRAHRLR